MNKTYCPQEYRTFHIFEPKPRLISAAAYRDRVVHHALCNVIILIFEKGFIRDSYANRVGYGSHRALRRFTQFYRSSKYVFQGDIQKYFPSIDRALLKEIIRRKLKCPDTLDLIDKIIDRGNEQEPAIFHFPGDDLLTPLERSRGLPIGNLTSQFFANVYLNGFDRFVKETLKFRKYVRYVDDFALFADERSRLVEAREQIEDYLSTLRLKIHPIKSQIFSTSVGGNFVGFRIFRDRIRVRPYNLQQARKRLQQLRLASESGTLTDAQIQQSLQSWIAHLQHGDTWHLRQQIWDSHPWLKERAPHVLD